jgi:hypothetical protein
VLQVLKGSKQGAIAGKTSKVVELSSAAAASSNVNANAAGTPVAALPQEGAKGA